MRVLALLVLACLATTATAAEIGFDEAFGLAADRTKALESLTPGTEDFYYYSALAAQHASDVPRFQRVLAEWQQRLGTTERMQVLKRRQMLLDFARDPRGSLEQVRSELGLSFNHRRIDPAAQAQVPTEWNATLNTVDQRLSNLLQASSSLAELTDDGLSLLVGKSLTVEQQRDLLNRLTRPDYPGITTLVLAELADRGSSGFGALAAHKLLTMAQLEELAAKRPQLMKEDRFVRALLARMRPPEQVDLDRDLAARSAYLARLASFARGLDPVHNSLKALVLYHILRDARARGEYPKQELLEYLAVPREVAYLAPVMRDRAYGASQAFAQLAQSYEAETGLAPVQNDEELVRDYLATHLIDAQGLAGFEAFIDDDWLRKLQARTRILAGDKEVEKYAAVLSPSDFQALKERVDLEILPTNPTLYSTAGPVKLAVKVKNVKNLIVKAFEINPFNLYRETQTEIDQAIDLDGLVAAHEESFTYDTPPLQSVSRTFEFPWIQGRGVWVVELVGNGKSSRALIRKGRLHLLEEPSTAGQAFRVIDETGAEVKDARVWVAGKESTPDESGRILLPFAEREGPVTVIVRQGNFASLAQIVQRTEAYALRAGFHVDREALAEGRTAKLIVRSSLRLAGRPVSIGLMKNVRLTVEATDLDGVASREEIADFKLEDDREAVHELHVPERLASLRWALAGHVESMRDGKPVNLEASGALTVNQQLRTRGTHDWYLRRTAGAYQLICRGRNGEPFAGRTVNVNVHHRAFQSEISQYLRTDENGSIKLGALPGADSVSVSAGSGETRQWALGGDEVRHPSHITVAAGEEIALPLLDPVDPVLPPVSLLEEIAGQFAHDRTAQAKVEPGRVLIAGLTPGMYDLLLRPGNRVTLEVGPAATVASYVKTPREAVPATPSRYAGISQVTVEPKEVVIGLHDAGPDTRVHVLGTWTAPAFSIFRDLLPDSPGERLRIPLEPAESMYASGRTVGDEYRYVLERRYAAKHPGVMLDRPGLVLNPWALRDSGSDVQEAASGEGYASRKQKMTAPYAAVPPAPPPPPGGRNQSASSLDWLDVPPVVLVNLVPANGAVRVPREGLPPDVRIVVTGRNQHLERRLSLDDPNLPVRDRRLAASLDVAQAFATTKLTSSLTPAKPLEIADRGSSRLRAFRSLREAYDLLATLCPDSRFAEFRFLVDWGTLSGEEKLKKYNEFASHELHFFLRRKDPQFFAEVVRPFIQNKLEKTFLDRWLLEADLSRYLEPWPYQQLNAVERILLARRTNHLDALARRFSDQTALVNTDPERWNRLFAAALNTGSLGGDRGMVEEKRMDSTGTLLREVQVGRNEALGGAPAPAAPSPVLLMAPAATAAAEPEAVPADAMSEDLVEAELESDAKKDMAPKGKAANRQLVNLTKSYVDKLARDEGARGRMRQLFRKADKTKELVENHYYHRAIAEQNADLIQLNDFWLDYARAASEDGFLSGRFPLAASNAAEAILALSVLDLPFSAPPLKSVVTGVGLSVVSSSPAIVFHEEVKPTPRAAGKARVLVSQDFYPADARHRMADGKQVDNFVTDEFIAGTPYACDVVITNPGSLPIDLDVLVQVPAGAIALEGGKLTKSLPARIEPYNTWKPTFVFYFPKAGDFDHHPVEIAHRGEVIARAEPFRFHVVDRPTKVDRTSWDELSQHGTDEEVLAYLKDKSLERLDLSKIAFRMQNKDVFSKTIEVLRGRRAFDAVLWSYGVHHQDAAIAKEYLETTNLPGQVGPYLASALLSVDPVERGQYQHYDYDPLIHARAHPLGTRRQILNPQLADEYNRLLKTLSHKPALDERDWLEVAYYLLLQDRVEEGLAAFDRVDRTRVTAQLQYDYLHAIVKMLRGDTDGARGIAEARLDCRVPRWQQRFQQLVDQVGAKAPAPAPSASPDAVPVSRDTAQDRLASTEASLDVDIDAKILRVSHRNVQVVTINYYPMDVELLFSRSPFVQDQTSRFSFVAPKKTETVACTPDQPVTKHPLPEELATSNLMIEVVSGGLRASKPYYASSLTVQVIEAFGQLEVAHLEGLKPAPRLYVKCFARMKDGAVRFYKDGYTDHRQRFDYATLSTDELDRVDRFAILVLSDTLGAVVREASPPRR